MRTERIVIVVLLIMFIAGSLGCAVVKPIPATTPEFIQRQGVLVPGIMESTPFVMHDTLYSMVSARDLHEIQIYSDSTEIAFTTSPLVLASAIVYSNILFVLGSVNNDGIYIQTTDDFSHWTPVEKVLDAPAGMQFFNNSITRDFDGNFIMAVETCEPGTVCFNVRFYKSIDLHNWTPIGTVMSPNAYAACPTIRYINGAYYIFYLKHVGEYFATYIARSYDLVSFDESPQVVVSTRLYEATEGINASDLDLAEYNGVVYINYADGNQTSWVNIHRATYQGTLTQFVKEFFP